jgi:nickel superoxide dismutase
MRHIRLITAIVLTAALASVAGAHCQIPCGIYDDMMRIRMMEEHVTTIEKSIRLIGELSDATEPGDVNQLVRWISNKDQHADYIGEIVTEYFLRQRIKAPSSDDATARETYLKQLEVLHQLLRVSMKAKQTVDPKIGDKLRALIDQLSTLYFSPEDLKHLKEHAH